MSEPASVDEVLEQLGPDARWGRVVVAHLAAGPATIDELVHASGLSRRTVERLIAAVEGAPGPAIKVADGVASDRVRLPQLDVDSETVRTLADLIERAPPPRHGLDQIPADAETVVARAALLRSQFEVGGRLLFLGDHDLTSIAAALVMPAVEITVVDIDEPLLEFLDAVATERGLTIRTLFADLRNGLPEELLGQATLVFTDPPYSADGVALFLERALSALGNRERGRVVIAYGAGDHRPDLALAVQERMQRLRVVIEAIYPSFNRYVLAQAIGGWSDLYVCRPTAGTWKRLGRTASTRRLYTQGPQAEESTDAAIHSPAVAAAIALVPDGSVVDLRREPDELLLRVLHAADAPVAVIVRNNHADIVDERSQRALLDLVEPGATVRFHRSTPDSSTAIVAATPTNAGLSRTARPRPPPPVGGITRGIGVTPSCDDLGTPREPGVRGSPFESRRRGREEVPLSELRELCAQLRGVLRSSDPALSPGDVCADIAEDLAATEKAVAAARLRYAVRAVECGEHRKRGHAGPAEWVSRSAGSSVGEARADLATTAALDECEATREAVGAGELSLAQAAEVVRVPGCEAELLGFARAHSLRSLREKARRRHLERVDPDELHAEQHRQRGVNHHRDELKMVRGTFAFAPAFGVRFTNRLDAETDRVWREARRSGLTPTRAQCAADAFERLFEGKGVGAGRTDLVLVYDLDAYARGHAHPGEVAQILGGGPLPVSIARRLAVDAFVKVVLHHGTKVDTVIHYGRRRPTLLQTILDLGDPPDFDGVACADEGCDRRFGLQWDHVDPAAHDGPVSYANLQPLCFPHHQEKTERDRAAGLLNGNGTRERNRKERGPP